jgi:lipopolysaccharide biosynthesis glycosyltransferase
MEDSKSVSRKCSMNNIYVGWDSREDIAYQVCEHSILRRTYRGFTNVAPLKQNELRDRKLYWRETDKLSSTEFTFTRFLVPHLNQYKGWAVFCDCDMVWLTDASDLFLNKDPSKAVYVVKHDYTPPEGTKMDGQLQLPYPRKNWSSFILWNCEHPKNKLLDLETVNNQAGQWLHRFSWLDDEDIGELSLEWNWLVGHYTAPADGEPKVLHYTEGGPWFENMRDCEYDHIWKKEVINLYSS